MDDVDRYHSWYGIDGIFVDEAAHSDEQLSYYQALSSHIRASGTSSSSSTRASSRHGATSTRATSS